MTQAASEELQRCVSSLHVRLLHVSIHVRLVHRYICCRKVSLRCKLFPSICLSGLSEDSVCVQLAWNVLTLNIFLLAANSFSHTSIQLQYEFDQLSNLKQGMSNCAKMTQPMHM